MASFFLLSRVSGLDVCYPGNGVKTTQLNRETKERAETPCYPSGCLLRLNGSADSGSSKFVVGSHPGNICAFCISDDGKYAAIASQSEEPNIQVVWTETRKLLHTFEDYDQAVAAMCFSRDSKYLFTFGGALSRQYFLFEVKSGSIGVSSLVPGEASVVCVSSGGFLKDVKRRDTDVYMFGSCGDRSLLLWTFEPASNLCRSIPITTKHFRDYTSCTFSPDGEFFIAATRSGDLVSVGMRNQAPVGAPCLVGGCATALACRDRFLLAGCVDGSVTMLEIGATGPKPVGRVCVGNFPVHSLSWDFVSLANGDIFLISDLISDLDEKPPTLVAPTLVARNTHAAVSELFSFESTFLSISNEVLSWTADASQASLLYRSAEQLTCGAANGVLAVVGSVGGKILGIDKVCAKNVWEIAHLAVPAKLALARNMQSSFVGFGDGAVALFDLRSRQAKVQLKEHRGAVTGLKFFSDQSFGITSSRDGSVMTWDLMAGKRITCHRESHTGLTAFLLIDEACVLASTLDKRLVVWDLRSQDLVRSVSVHDQIVSLADFGGVKKFFAGTVSGYVELWELEGRVFRGEFPHGAPVSALCVVPDEDSRVDGSKFWLHSGGADKCVYSWRGGEGEEALKEESLRTAAGAVPRLNLASIA